MATKRPRSDSLASDSGSDNDVIDLTGDEPLAAAAPPVHAPVASGSYEHEEDLVAAAPDADTSLPGAYCMNIELLLIFPFDAYLIALGRRRLVTVRCLHS